MRDLYLPRRFFWALGALVALFLAAQAWGPLLVVAEGAALVLAAAVAADAFALWRTKSGLAATRDVPDKLSIGEANPVALRVASAYPFRVRARVLDEVPVQFQARDAAFDVELAPRGAHELRYTLRPTERGAYAFGRANLYAASPLGLVLRRFRTAADAEAAVYPSIVQMHRYAFLATSDRLAEAGVKRVRRVGHTMEFERIRAYVPGDDRRAVNWRATARRGPAGGPGGDLMVNEYEEERAQPVYAALDMGRAMRSPFDGLTLVDHAINAALVLLNIALLKGDRAGLVTFDDAVRTVIRADRRRGQIGRVLEALYRQQPGFRDPSFEALHATVRTALGPRGLVLLFTNFDTLPGLRRQLPYLRRIARLHRLVVVFFENTGLAEVLQTPAVRAEDVYVKAVAEGLEMEKREIARELERHGIGALLTRPEALTVDAINRYLEIKARGLV